MLRSDHILDTFQPGLFTASNLLRALVLLTAIAVAAVSAPEAGRTGGHPAAQTLPAGSQGAGNPEKSTRAGEETRQDMLALSPSWGRTDRPPDPDALRRLRSTTTPWQLEVVYGHWCTDSAREIPRLLAVLDGLKEASPGVRWVAVDEPKERPAEVIRRLGIVKVPTLVVRRGGMEIGRIVERAEPSIEALLVDILTRRGNPPHDPPAETP